jgi:hypothetical protein
MKVKGLNGREYNWKLTGRVPLKDDARKRSKYHLAARTLLTTLFPADRILEEVPLPGSKKLTLDFYIPSYRLAVEVQGEQHTIYNPFFHGNYLNYLAAKRRDNNKKAWCLINNLEFIEFSFMESEDEWRERVTRKISGSDKLGEGG